MAKLRPRARIIRTIGDQLISGPEAALIELVKNAYDADSPHVRIVISPPEDGIWNGESGSITVSDAGHGMSASDLVEKWFEPATSDKLERRLSPGGRRMLGAKGVGRFATAVLGRHLNLRCSSRIAGRRIEVHTIDLDWQQFANARYLDEVEIAVTPVDAEPGERPGVRLSIRGLNNVWTQKSLEHLVRELRRLTSPLGAREDRFQIFLDLNSFTPDIHGFDGQSLVSGALGVHTQPGSERDPAEIRPFNLDNIFHYRVVGIFGQNGRFEGTFLNQRGDGKPFSIDIPDTSLTPDEQPCGTVNLRLHIFDREPEAIDDLMERLGLGSVGRLDARRILDENIGIGIYRNGFRIRPYGDAETDWLELERMRVQDPSRKLGLNQVWGVVEIEDENSSGLVERSSREGLEHNGSFARLKRLVRDLLATVEADRFAFRESAGLSRRQAGDTGELKTRATMRATERAVAELPEKFRAKVERALRQDSSALKTAVADLETYQQALASRSALGLVVAQVLHDGRRFLAEIATKSKTLADGAPRLQEDSAFGQQFRSTFGKNAKAIHDSAGHLNKLFKALDPISGRKRGRPRKLDVLEITRRCIALFQDAIAAEAVKVDIVADGSPLSANGYEADLMAALLNVIDNAIHWLGVAPTKPRTLTITVSKSKKYVRLSIANNGPGIDERFWTRLFSPGFSLKTEGSGIGLAIAREAMRASKGDLAFDPGARETTFVIEMLRAKES